MRRYDDPVAVRRGERDAGDKPDQFIWRGRLWQVREVVSHWVETQPWWLGGTPDLLGEHEVWRVTAVDSATGFRSAMTDDPTAAHGPGVFDLALSLAKGDWTLARAQD